MDHGKKSPVTPDALAGHIDMTLLKPNITELEVRSFLASALKYPYASVCVPPCYVRTASTLMRRSNVKVSTVVGFPMGFQTPEIKLFEAVSAVKNGASEIDMVMNISEFRSGNDALIKSELSSIIRSVPGAAVKVIIECCYLTKAEKLRAVELIAESGAAFIKTSTGTGPGGATTDDIKLLKDAAAGRIRVKAAGGIRDLETTLAMIRAGADRIGTSGGAAIMEELEGRLREDD
jgi:deoxyribose-phosphate aldolase